MLTGTKDRSNAVTAFVVGDVIVRVSSSQTHNTIRRNTPPCAVNIESRYVGVPNALYELHHAMPYPDTTRCRVYYTSYTTLRFGFLMNTNVAKVHQLEHGIVCRRFYRRKNLLLPLWIV